MESRENGGVFRITVIPMLINMWESEVCGDLLLLIPLNLLSWKKQ